MFLPPTTFVSLLFWQSNLGLWLLLLTLLDQSVIESSAERMSHCPLLSASFLCLPSKMICSQDWQIVLWGRDISNVSQASQPRCSAALCSCQHFQSLFASTGVNNSKWLIFCWWIWEFKKDFLKSAPTVIKAAFLCLTPAVYFVDVWKLIAHHLAIFCKFHCIFASCSYCVGQFYIHFHLLIVSHRVCGESQHPIKWHTDRLFHWLLSV